MLMRFIALAVLPLFLLCSCNKSEELRLEKQVEEFKAEAAELEALIAQQEAINKELSRETSVMNAKTAKFKDLQKAKSEIASSHETVNRYYADLEASQEFLDERLAVWRKASRESMLDREIGTVRLTDGDILRKSVIKSIEENEVTLEHSSGTSAVAFENLPLDLRVALVHEPTILAQQKIKGSNP
jgi:predicted RNase H-like nuclease (RuvC/YqgF family)